MEHFQFFLVNRGINLSSFPLFPRKTELKAPLHLQLAPFMPDEWGKGQNYTQFPKLEFKTGIDPNYSDWRKLEHMKGSGTEEGSQNLHDVSS